MPADDDAVLEGKTVIEGYAVLEEEVYVVLELEGVVLEEEVYVVLELVGVVLYDEVYVELELDGAVLVEVV